MPIATALIRGRFEQATEKEVPGINPGAFLTLLPLTPLHMRDYCHELGVCYPCRGRGFVANLNLQNPAIMQRDPCPVCQGRSPRCVDDREFRIHLLTKHVRGFRGVVTYNPDGTTEPLAFSPQALEALAYDDRAYDAAVEAAMSLAVEVGEREGKASPTPPPASSKETTGGASA